MQRQNCAELGRWPRWCWGIGRRRAQQLPAIRPARRRRPPSPQGHVPGRPVVPTPKLYCFFLYTHTPVTELVSKLDTGETNHHLRLLGRLTNQNLRGMICGISHVHSRSPVDHRARHLGKGPQVRGGGLTHSDGHGGCAAHRNSTFSLRGFSSSGP